MALECPVAVQARILVACGPASRLEATIRQLLDRLEATRATNNIRREIELLAILSLAHERRGRRADALKVLATNRLNEGIDASPAAVGKRRLYTRLPSAY